MKKRIAIVTASILGTIILLAGVLYWLFSLGPIPFIGNGVPQIKQWESIEAAQQVLGSKFLYPTFPKWAKDYKVWASSQYKWGKQEKASNFFYLSVGAYPYNKDESLLRVRYYIMDLKDWNRHYDTPDISEITFYTYNRSPHRYEPDCWYDPDCFTEEFGNIQVSFAVMSLKARALFEIGRNQYGIVISSDKGWDIDPDDIPKSEFKNVKDDIMASLREMVQSIINQQ